MGLATKEHHVLRAHGVVDKVRPDGNALLTENVKVRVSVRTKTRAGELSQSAAQSGCGHALVTSRRTYRASMGILVDHSGE